MKTSVDLYPEEYYAYLTVRRRLMLWSALFAAVVVAVSMASFSLWREVHAAESKLSILEAQVQGMELWGAQLARERQRVLGQLVDEPAWSALLNELSLATGGQVWLRTFTIETERRADAEGEDDIVHSIAIFGYAETADDFVDFMTALNRSPYVTNVDQRYSRKSTEFENEDILEFQLQAMVI